MRALEIAAMAAIGAGEAAAFVAEQLAFEQRRRNGAAVDRHEGTVPPAAERVNGARHDVLAGAALAADQHAGARRRDAADQLEGPPHVGRAADEQAEAPGGVPLGLQALDFLGELPRVRDVPENRPQAIDVDRLGQVVGDAAAQRFDDRGHRRVAGDQHHRGRADAFDAVEQGHAAAVGEVEVEEHHVGHLPRERGLRFIEVRRGGRGEPLRAEHFRQRLERVGVVVDEQRVGHGRLLRQRTVSRVNSAVKQAPGPPLARW